MAMPSGWRSSEPTPVPSIKGSAAEHGRHRGHQDRPEPQQARLVDCIARRLALLRSACEREVDHHDRVLLDDADQQHDADDADHVQFEPATMSDSKAPTPAEGSVDRMVMGWMKLS